jgi:hypothetical protein
MFSIFYQNQHRTIKMKEQKLDCPNIFLSKREIPYLTTFPYGGNQHLKTKSEVIVSPFTTIAVAVLFLTIIFSMLVGMKGNSSSLAKLSIAHYIKHSSFGMPSSHSEISIVHKTIE